MTIVTFAITTGITVVGLILGNSVLRQQRLKIAERRMDAYVGLWEIMKLARPSRLDDWGGEGPLKRAEAKTLFDDMTKWYYRSGNGMMLTKATKRMYLQAKWNLGAYSIATESPWEHDGERRIRDLSLLRTQMKLDFDIFGDFYFDERKDDLKGNPKDELKDVEDERKKEEEDLAFLRDAGFDPKTWDRPPPWYRRFYERFKARAGGRSDGLASAAPKGPPKR